MGFGGNQKGNITDMDTIGNSSILINNVWLVDGLKHNILSIRQFCDSGYKVMFNKNNYIVTNESEKSIVFKRRTKGNFYKTNFSKLVNRNVLCLLLVSDEKWL